MPSIASNTLIVVADVDLATVVQRALRLEGRPSLIGRTLGEADLVLATVPVDAMVVDLAIGSESVLRWLGEIRRLRPELTRRTLVLTAQPLDFGEEDGLARCGALPLMLPATVDELRRALCAVASAEPPDDGPFERPVPGRARREIDS